MLTMVLAGWASAPSTVRPAGRPSAKLDICFRYFARASLGRKPFRTRLEFLQYRASEIHFLQMRRWPRASIVISRERDHRIMSSKRSYGIAPRTSYMAHRVCSDIRFRGRLIDIRTQSRRYEGSPMYELYVEREYRDTRRRTAG